MMRADKSHEAVHRQHSMMIELDKPSIHEMSNHEDSDLLSLPGPNAV